MHVTAAPVATIRRASRLLVLVAAVLAAVFMLSFTSFAAVTRAASPAPHGAASTTVHQGASAPEATAPKRAVLIVGPVGGQTSDYVAGVKAIRDALTAAGVAVTLILPPHATWAAVKSAADGADFFAYLGHGNGFPSPYTANGEESHDGLGLNPTDGDTNSYDVKYYGSNYIRGGYHCTLGGMLPSQPITTKAACLAVQYGVWQDYGAGIHLAPDAIVLLNRLCYAEGNAEPGMALPNQATAFDRVDNFSQGFLAAGAKVVFALAWQPGVDLANWLVSQHKTMDGIFQMRDSATSKDPYMPYHGWVGKQPNVYLNSVRTPGAQVHLDPDLPNNGWLRAVTGDLSFTTDQWWNGGDSTDTTPPVLTDLTAPQASNTIPADASGPTIFTPNGDGISDTLTIDHTLSEASYLNVSVANSSGTVVRGFTSYSAAGVTNDAWDGKNNSAKVVGDGTYTITVTPTDEAGNVGDAVSMNVLVLTAMKSPAASPTLFYSADGDALAQSSTLSVTLTKNASLTWVVTDAANNVVKTGMADQAESAGPVSWTWDGTNDSATPVPDGVYYSLVTAQTSAGSYSHKIALRVMPFKVSFNHSSATAGTSMKITIITAEPQKSWPTVNVKQPGLASYRLYLVKYSTTKFTATWKLKAGGTPGTVKLTITGTDTGGGVVTRVFNITKV